MNYNYNMDWTTGKLIYVGTPTTPSANGGNPGFGNVKDFTFFNTNYADLLWDNSVSTQHNISVLGRKDRNGYRISFGYMNDGSPLRWGINSNSRYNVRFSNDYQVSDKFKVETNLSLEKNDIIQPTNTGFLGQYQQPGFPIETKNGQPYAWGTQYSSNWLARYGGETKEYNTRVFTSVKTTYDFTKHLQFIGQGSYNANFTDIKTEKKSISWWNYAGYMQAAMRHIKPYFASGEIKRRGVFVAGTVMGDMHDIGKNIVAMNMEGAGWEVIDLGIDVKAEQFMEAIEQHPGCVIGMSALLTTTMSNMEKTVSEIKDRYPDNKIIVGGAPLSMEFCKKIGADFYSPSPQGAVEYLNNIAV